MASESNSGDFRSAPDIAQTTVASVEAGLEFYGHDLEPGIRDAIMELVHAGYATASTEGKLDEFDAAAHMLSRRVVDGLLAAEPHSYVVKPAETVIPITDAETLFASICDVVPVWPFCR